MMDKEVFFYFHVFNLKFQGGDLSSIDDLYNREPLMQM